MAAQRPTDPQRLDVAAFADQGQTLSGQWPLQALPRLAEGASDEQTVDWRLSGERRTRLGAEPQTWLHIEARAHVPMQCQRCLQPVLVDIEVDHWLQFVAGGEEVAAALDADAEDDVLPLQRSIDARALVEDEMLLALPIVPRHEICPEPLPMSYGEDEQPTAEEAATENPFAVLAKLKGGSGGH